MSYQSTKLIDDQYMPEGKKNKAMWPRMIGCTGSVISDVHCIFYDAGAVALPVMVDDETDAVIGRGWRRC
jgi:hypothetical protein